MKLFEAKTRKFISLLLNLRTAILISVSLSLPMLVHWLMYTTTGYYPKLFILSVGSIFGKQFISPIFEQCSRLKYTPFLMFATELIITKHSRSTWLIVYCNLYLRIVLLVTTNIISTQISIINSRGFAVGA